MTSMLKSLFFCSFSNFQEQSINSDYNLFLICNGYLMCDDSVYIDNHKLMVAIQLLGTRMVFSLFLSKFFASFFQSMSLSLNQKPESDPSQNQSKSKPKGSRLKPQKHRTLQTMSEIVIKFGMNLD